MAWVAGCRGYGVCSHVRRLATLAYTTPPRNDQFTERILHPQDHRKKAARVIDELLDGIPSQHGLKKD